MKKCPFCAEEIQDEAIVCRYCGRDLRVRANTSKRPISNNRWVLIILVIVVVCMALNLNKCLGSSSITSTNTAAPIILKPKSSLTNTLIPSMTYIPSFTPTNTDTFTPLPPGTLTAQAIDATRTSVVLNVTATRLAYNATLTSIAFGATATRVAYDAQRTVIAEETQAMAAQIAQYKDIDWRELANYADNHKGEKVKVRIMIFNIISTSQLQGYFAGTYEAVVVEMSTPFSGLYENDYITAYGTVYGSNCFTNALNATICQPELTDAFYTKP